MRINTKQTFINLEGEVLKAEDIPLTLGEVLANVVLAPHKDKNGFRPIKAVEMARKFHGIDAQEVVELDRADFIQIKELVEHNESYIPLVTGLVLEALESIKE